ncbi:ATP-binding cassette domain-containing protein [Pelagicoccus sp. SDUM812002]|uniref:ATP-binding cassette domain-containing protein n=1 Tax=Pelagicoccus sp. SDUM812002 TaxID=3041266 RepID=UPI00280C90E1|nr:ATP-binding cassette domain-containing protein [Pelagicoccus sp. SDUM812002]MDQ8187819.1 ATP-binding cassette domain-containing protein [Pelagicoccus sp. SDUM812002]
MRIQNLKTSTLHLSDWTLQAEETWCVLGNNASGKSQLAAVLCGEDVKGLVELDDAPKNAAWVGFETLQSQYEDQLAQDESDFLDRQDHGSTGLELLLESGATESEAREQAQRFGISALLDRGCRLFSSGELRRVQILVHWLSKPDLLILDEPFDALDIQAYAECSALFELLVKEGQRILLLVNRIEDIAPWVSHIALLQDGKLVAKGPRYEVLQSKAFTEISTSVHKPMVHLPEPPKTDIQVPDPIVRLIGVCVNYSDATQFEGLDWTLQDGDHTLITGPNGCGKSTLLALLTGDHPQCYTNHIEIFGYRRGSGESIWDIKRHIGYVSPALHRDYRVSCSVDSAVLSGFHDSIGLYEQPTLAERTASRQWLALFDLEAHSTRPFRSLSYGQQRLVLIARALVKQPPLVILDEPTQGLDDLNRHLVLACLKRLARLKRTTLLFVSHRQDEHLPLFRKRLHFEVNTVESPRFTIRKLN